MTDRDHMSYREEIGAYLLGALTDLERQAFEQHLGRCAECRAEIEELRPAADALPRSVEQVEPPPGLKTSLMEIVEREARQAAAGKVEKTGDEGGRTVIATVDQSRIPQGSGNLRVEGDGDDGAILRVSGMPDLGGEQVYQAWVQRGGMIIPQPTFEVGPDGSGAVAVPEDLSDAAAVLVTREQRGGASAPSEEPILSVPL